MLDDDRRVAADHAVDLETHGRDTPRRDVTGGDVEGLGGGFALVAFGDGVQRDVQPGGQLAKRRAPRDRQHAWLEQDRHLVERLAEPHDVEHHDGAVVGGVVGDLHTPHLLDTPAGAREGQRDQIGDESRVDAVDIDTRITQSRSIFHRSDELVRDDLPGELQHTGCRAHHIDSGGQDAPDVVHGLRHPGVAHGAVHRAFRFGRQQRVKVIGGCDPGRDVQARQLAGILADLGRGGDTKAGQLEGRVLDQFGQREPADVAGADVDDANGHDHSMRSGGKNWNRF